ncbi:MAG: hypothetical protein ABSG62_17580 [Terracidiphilus sp.]|jgi:hypothetical protein
MLLAALAPGTVAQQPGLVVGCLTLAAALDGFDGQLELLEDARLTPNLQKALWGTGAPDMALDVNDSRYQELTSIPLRKAVLQLRGAQRKVIAEKTLQRELARTRLEELHPARRLSTPGCDGEYVGPDLN